MISNEEIARLVMAHERVREALTQKKPRRAAKVLCEELTWLSDDKGSFWARVADASDELQRYREQEREVLRNVTRLMEQEGAIFERLGIDASEYGPIIATVYGRITEANRTLQDPSPQAIGVLHDDLKKATKLICEHTKGPIRETLEWCFTWKGATAIAGAATIGANIGAMMADGGVLSWTSLKAGYDAARGEIDGIIGLFG
jgi:hypothetical protein